MKIGDRVRNRLNHQIGVVLYVEPEQRGRTAIVKWEAGTYDYDDLQERTGHQFLGNLEAVENT